MALILHCSCAHIVFFFILTHFPLYRFAQHFTDEELVIRVHFPQHIPTSTINGVVSWLGSMLDKVSMVIEYTLFDWTPTILCWTRVASLIVILSTASPFAW